MAEPLIQIKNLVKKFDDKFALNRINLDIYSHEFVTLLGPSGCGKTTTLRIVGGFEQPDSGQVLFESKDLLAVPPYKRPINTVFQKYALFPHMNVKENIAFGLRIRKIPSKEIEEKIITVLRKVNLEDYANRAIHSLSGGQQQRVAIARAIVNEPKILLLDEPLGALDLKLRQDMQYELKTLQQDLGITFIYVTHDQEEALTMSDRIVVMKSGKIQQIGSPQDIYNEPINQFVADFIGESNILPGKMLDDYKVQIQDIIFSCVDKGFLKNESVVVVIRPEDIILKPASSQTIQGIITDVVFKGVHYEIIVVDKESNEWVIHSIHQANVNEEVSLEIQPDAIHIMKG